MSADQVKMEIGMKAVRSMQAIVNSAGAATTDVTLDVEAIL